MGRMEEGKIGEVQRIREAYARRAAAIHNDRYSAFNAAGLFAIQSRERALITVLKRHGFYPLHEKRILDVGCGTGGVLRSFIQYGADPGNLCGIDLLEDRIETARRLSPNIDFRCGNAEKLPYPDESFDIILQFTVFTSILDPEMKRNIAWEMLRVLKPDGIIIWYNYHMDNPKNPDVKGVKKTEIYTLFPGCSIDLRRATLAPPLARLLAPYSYLVCYLLEKIPFLCTHYLGVIRKGR